VGGGWTGVFMKNRPYRDGNKREVAYLGCRLGYAALGFWCEHCSVDVVRLLGSGMRAGLKASWNNGFGSPVFCSAMSLSSLPKDCIKYCQTGSRRKSLLWV
jgi:hypothetical protein